MRLPRAVGPTVLLFCCLAGTSGQEWHREQIPTRRIHDEIKSHDSGVAVWWTAEFRAGWPRGITPPGLPQIRTCPLRHTARHVMISPRYGTKADTCPVL
jgi:hypothetical protein